MKNKRIIIFFLLIFYFISLGYIITNLGNTDRKITEIREPANVTRIIDGDTIETNLGKVRLLGINNKSV